MPYYEFPFDRIKDLHVYDPDEPPIEPPGPGLIPVWPCETKTVTLTGNEISPPASSLVASKPPPPQASTHTTFYEMLLIWWEEFFGPPGSGGPDPPPAGAGAAPGGFGYVSLGAPSVAGGEGTFIYPTLSITCCPSVPSNKRPPPSVVGYDDPYFVPGAWARSVLIETTGADHVLVWDHTNPATLLWELFNATAPPPTRIEGGSFVVFPTHYDVNDPVASMLGTSLSFVRSGPEPIVIKITHDCRWGPGGDTFPFQMVAPPTSSEMRVSAAGDNDLKRRVRMMTPRCGELGQ